MTTRMGPIATCQDTFPPSLPLDFLFFCFVLFGRNVECGPELHKVNDPTIHCCFWLPTNSPGLGFPNSSLPSPSRQGTRRRLQAFLPQRLGLQWLVADLTPTLIQAQRHLSTPHPLPHPSRPLGKARALKSKSKLTSGFSTAYKRKTKHPFLLPKKTNQ